MARQDIQVDVVYGEVPVTDNLTNKVFYPFLLFDEMQGEDNEHYCYGEIAVPSNFETKYRDENGIHIYIPYYPLFKELQIRFRMDNPNGSIEYLRNRTNNLIWFPAFADSDKSPIRLSEYYNLNENGNFNLLMKDGFLVLYSGDETDFEIKAALSQNEVFLLKAMAGNLYQYPTTGVGLIEFLHGNFENTGLAAKLQQEFENDNMIIKNAYMDSVTGELLLDVEEKNG